MKEKSRKSSVRELYRAMDMTEANRQLRDGCDRDVGLEVTVSASHRHCDPRWHHIKRWRRTPLRRTFAMCSECCMPEMSGTVTR